MGRSTEADLRINDPGVSRRHAELRVTRTTPGGPLQVSVVDLGSTNGTLLDGRRIDDAPVEDGSVLRLGSTDLTVRVTTEEG